MSSKINLTCDNCKKQFERYKSNARPSKNIFCTKKCMQDFNSGKTEKRICKNCTKEFVVYASSLRSSNASGNYCCRPCYNEHLKALLKGEDNHNYNRIKCVCPNCEKEFMQIPSKVKQYKNVFCSHKCKNKFMYYYTGGEKNCNWVGGCKSYRGDFAQVKKENFNKKQFCAICGSVENIHIHHIIPYRLTQDNSIDNLIPLCSKHHKIIESSTLNFINITEDKEVAKKLLNIILRSRQTETCNVLLKISEGKKMQSGAM